MGDTLLYATYPRKYYENKNSLISEGVKSFVFLWSKMWIE